MTKDSLGTKKHFTGKYLSVTKKSFKILLSNEQPTLQGTSGKKMLSSFSQFLTVALRQFHDFIQGSEILYTRINSSTEKLCLRDKKIIPLQ